MKTKPIPAIVMLTAGFITCIAGIVEHMEIVRFTRVLLIVLVLFYVLGMIARAVLDMNFKEKTEDTTDGEETEAGGETSEKTEQSVEEQEEK